MKVELVESPDKELIDFFEKRLEEFNVARWEIKEKRPIAVKVTDESGHVVAGAAGKTFGTWLLLDNLWVGEPLRGQDLGSKILLQIESAAKNRGCHAVLLETLNFQARPFYEKHGYKLQWTQDHYPKDGCKFFMVKYLEALTRPTIQRTFSGAPWEAKVGYCRAIRAGNTVAVTGTASVGDDGKPFGCGDAYSQAKRCFEIIEKAIKPLGCERRHIIRTRMFVTDIKRWQECGRAHAEFFGDTPPTTSMIEVKALIDPEMLIEIEADGVICD